MKNFTKPGLLSIFLILSLLVSNAQEVVHEFSLGMTAKLTGQYGREAISTDELLFRFCYGNLTLPSQLDSAGSFVEVDSMTWESLEADKNGWFNHRNLRGGYLVVEYSSPRNANLILEANGHNEVFVNGEPRGGDIYGYGWVEHPVSIQKGKNIFIFRGGRGRVTARLIKPKTDVILSQKDALLPDLISDDFSERYGSVKVINVSAKNIEGYKIQAEIENGEILETDVPLITPFSSREVAFLTKWTRAVSTVDPELNLYLIDRKGKIVSQLNQSELVVNVKNKQDKHKETFISGIDGSVQYYSVVPATGSDSLNALVLTLHGASVEAVNQANAYGHKTWATIVAPTNRRPYGFDWEDWGRWDAQEVLEIAKTKYRPDPSRLYLTGHSMGGHGTWQIGATLPGNWAAIGPSAGWYSFWSYAGKTNELAEEPISMLINKSTNPSNTLGISQNYLNYGIYILHGDQDDNVPVSQARFMRKHLADFHPDFAYYERPGAGHWWGNECVDWPLMFDFFKAHKRQEVSDLRSMKFVTATPGVSSESRHLAIIQQISPLEFSSINYEMDEKNKTMNIVSDNVQALKVDFEDFPENQPYQLDIDGNSFKYNPGEVRELLFKKKDSVWILDDELSALEKGPHRNGLFKDAFRNRMVFVYATNGTAEENKWSYDKARFDAETFWYRANGSVELISDRDFKYDNYLGRNIIIYGHSDMNSAWKVVLGECPINVTRGKLSIGNKTYNGADLATYFIYPKSGSEAESVGVIAGTGMPGLKATIPNRYFVSGSGFPDFVIFQASMYQIGIDAVLGAGFFNNQWSLSDAELYLK